MSVLYQPHRGLGLYSAAVPLILKLQPNGDYFIHSAVKHYFSVFRLSDLAIISTSDRLTETIISMSYTGNNVFCGCQTTIFGFKRAKHIYKQFKYEDKNNWKIVLTLEKDAYLCGVCETNMLVIWDIFSGKEVFTSQFPSEEFDICQIMQPTGYIDMLLVASKQGSFHLINYKTRETLSIINFENEVSVVHQSPEADIIAIGFVDGTILLHNILYNKTLINVHHDLGAISSISFREESLSELIMLSGSKNGHVTMWNINKGRNVGQTRDCHHGPVSTLFCVPGKPLLISSSSDNSIKVWNYDRPDGTPILLNSRQGHWMPPSFIDYWPSGSLSTQIISGGNDSVMNVFSTFQEKHNFSMGRGYLPHHGKREDRLTKEQYVLPPAKDIACNTIRDGFWDSMVVCHKNHRQVSTWTFSKRCRGKYYLDHFQFQKNEFKYSKVCATKCALSMCGNFVVVGYSSGHLVKYNLQSGKERGVFGEPSGHEEEIVGLVVGLSGYNMVVVSADVSGKVCMWNFVTNKMISELSLPLPIKLIKMHPNKDMIAVVTIDGFVNLIQLMNLIVFQKLRCSLKGDLINAVSFTYLKERMVIADGNLIKTYDYINQKLIDCFKVQNVVTNVIISPNDAFLVTTHEEDLGVYLWALKTQCKDLKLPSLKEDFIPEKFIDLPMASIEYVDLDKSMIQPPTIIEETQTQTLATFCSKPLSFLANLLNIEHIKVKSEMAIRGVSSSSFFIPQMIETLDGIKWKDEENNQQEIFNKNKKRKFDETKNSDIVLIVNLHSKLSKAENNNEYDECMAMLSKLTAASVDHEIQMMHPKYHMGNTTDNLIIDAFLRLIINQLSRKRSVDLCQMFIAILLKHNSDCLNRNSVNNEEDDPLQINGDIIDAEMKEKNTTLSLVNHSLEHLNSKLYSDLNIIQQMALLALLK